MCQIQFDKPESTKMDDNWENARSALNDDRNNAQALGGKDALKTLARRGKLTARQRIEQLLDPGTFQEIGQLVRGKYRDIEGKKHEVAADAVVTGWGEINGQQVMLVADDGSVMGGAGSTLNVEKRFRLRTMAIEAGCPFIGLYEGSAIRFQDSMDAGQMARIPAFKEVIDCAGKVPQVAAVMGPCYGRPPLDVLYADFSVQVEKTGFLGLSGPALVAGGIGEDVEMDVLSGTQMHVDRTGIVDRAAANEASCLELIRTFLRFVPASAWARGAPPIPDPRPCPELTELVPSNLRKPYDMSKVLDVVMDPTPRFAYKPTFGRSVLTELGLMGGGVVGVVASQPQHKGGVMDADACLKVRRFVAVCDAFHIPLLFLQDQPGFMIGKQAEEERILLWAGALLGCVQRATVPKVTVVLRKCHGAAAWSMGGQNVGGNIVAAWPIAIMTGTGPASAVNTIHARELSSSDAPAQRRSELEARYAASGSALLAARTFGIDEVIDPAETRTFVTRCFAMQLAGSREPVSPKVPLFP